MVGKAILHPSIVSFSFVSEMLTHITRAGFQASKFLPQHPEIAQRIRDLRSPREALQEASHLTHLRRADWFDVNVAIMDAILEAKFTQHDDLRDLLLSTNEREIVEASPVSCCPVYRCSEQHSNFYVISWKGRLLLGLWCGQTGQK